ncbi:STEROL 3-BETA-GLUCOSYLTRANSFERASE [Salix viminalis]|uniref:STEROL 3-BETA-GLUCOSYLTRANSFERASE n=1 Tax=Salix viminalis TaxID=40686 RepID=A0A9Q0UTX3_SALVM|nr:STEROL 3-BETA-GLUCOSYLTRANSFERASE [Salix viminalis]
MVKNGFDHPLKHSEDVGLGTNYDLNKSFDQTSGGDESVTVDYVSWEKHSEAGSSQEAEKQKTSGGDESVTVDYVSWEKHSEAGSSQEAEKQKTKSGKQPSPLEVFKSKNLDLSPSSQRGLNHRIAALVDDYSHPLFDDDDNNITFYRSHTESRASRYELKLNRLSELEKKKLIIELVKIQNDGTVEVDIDENAPVASELLGLHSVEGASFYVKDSTSGSNKSIPKLKIAMLVVGTRGDVQPFLAIAERLQEFGHHVRLATHANFCSFVRSAGVEFYPLGGDPLELAGYMARNKGFIPQLLQTLRHMDMFMLLKLLAYQFTFFFTMPWTPTYEFPHPLARVSQSAGYWLSYIVVDLLIWWGIRAYINEFRKRKLKLPPIAYFSTYHGSISHLPTGYMWSPHLVPKPIDWGPLVDVELNPYILDSGACLLKIPRILWDVILEALKVTGQRGIVDQGWGDLGNLMEVPDSVFLLKDCPHDWLFLQCAAVVHHGGAGTTATGLRAGCPTTIVPFFGDQFFWGDRVHQKGLGPAPIPIAKLSVEKLSNAIRFMLEPEVKFRVMELAKLIENDDGVGAAVDAFHRHLPPELPLPTSSSEDNDQPNPLQWFFIQIEKWCCPSC